MTTHARLALIVTLSILIPGAGIALSQATGGSPGTPSSSGAGPAGEANAQPAGGGVSTKACTALCDFAASSKDATATQALVATLEAEVSQGSSTKQGECECAGGSKLTYKVKVSSTGAKISGSEGIVVAITTDKRGNSTPGEAQATNTGTGDAIASAGSNTGTGTGGSAVATTTSGTANASGGDSGGSNKGGGGSATTTTGTANAVGGAGGNAGGSGTSAGGQGGPATAKYGGTTASIDGITPLAKGVHGSQTRAWFGSGAFGYGIYPGIPVPN